MRRIKQFFLCLLVLGIGLSVCGYGLCLSVGVVDMLANGERAEAVVTDAVRKTVKSYSRKGGTRTSARYYLSVTYQDAQGVTHTSRAGLYDDSPHRKGERLTIIYKPEAPEEVMLDDWSSRCAPTLFPVIFGLVFAAVGIALFRDYREDVGGAKPQPCERGTGRGMCIPAYWVRETREIAGMRFRLHGSSAVSMEEARERLQCRIELQTAFHEDGRIQLATYKRRLAKLSMQEKEDAYAVEIFEPTLERLSGQSLVTRNRYGAEVLNTTELCFVDIDSYPSGWSKWLFFLKSDPRREEQCLLRDLEQLCRAEADLGIRLYRTAGGWRLIVMGEGLAPDSARMDELFDRVQADAAYANLCRRQQCWRARVTPKPGRLGGIGRCPRRDSSDTPAEGEGEWLRLYEEKGQAYAVCCLLATFGQECRHSLVAWHDERTGASRVDWPLA